MVSEWYDRDGQPLDMWGWAALLADDDYKLVARETAGDLEVSTVWLGLNHNMTGEGRPLIFETMVFEAVSNRIVQGPIRYATESAAKEGHKWIVDELKRRNKLLGGPL